MHKTYTAFLELRTNEATKTKTDSQCKPTAFTLFISFLHPHPFHIQNLCSSLQKDGNRLLFKTWRRDKYIKHGYSVLGYRQDMFQNLEFT